MTADPQSVLTGKGLIIAAPASGSGKTLITLGLLRVLKQQGIDIRSAKAGPDYIDPQFHSRASGKVCANLDPWAMRSQYLQQLATKASTGGPMLIEGMMGLFDGTIDGSGSVADLAAQLGLPIILVVDAARQSHSISALVEGFSNHRDDVAISGIILNRVGSDRHEAMLRSALALGGIPVIGAIKRIDGLAMPERHLGLVQADERADLEQFIECAALEIGNAIDVNALLQSFAPLNESNHQALPKLRPPGQRIAIARDLAFAFSYSHIIAGWQEQGAEINFFSPLNNEPPVKNADAIYLPGGYPELHADTLSKNQVFIQALVAHAQSGTTIYGECGGYMMLGEGLVDRDGKRHKMAGLLPLTTSFENPKLTLGYREVRPLDENSMIPSGCRARAHEFHYSSVENGEFGDLLFEVRDAAGTRLASTGLRRKNVSGSFVHLIDLI